MAATAGAPRAGCSRSNAPLRMHAAQRAPAAACGRRPQRARWGAPCQAAAGGPGASGSVESIPEAGPAAPAAVEPAALLGALAQDRFMPAVSAPTRLPQREACPETNLRAALLGSLWRHLRERARSYTHGARSCLRSRAGRSRTQAPQYDANYEFSHHQGSLIPEVGVGSRRSATMPTTVVAKLDTCTLESLDSNCVAVTVRAPAEDKSPLPADRCRVCSCTQSASWLALAPLGRRLNAFPTLLRR